MNMMWPEQTIHYIPSEYNHRVVFHSRSKKQQLAKRSHCEWYVFNLLEVLVRPLDASLPSEIPTSEHCSLAGISGFSAYWSR
jgi:hypothetical protein